MFAELTWYSLDKICEMKLGPKHKMKTPKQKRDWALAQGWEIITNKKGIEGVAFSTEDEGIMKMKVGSRFSAEKVRRDTFESAEDGRFNTTYSPYSLT